MEITPEIMRRSVAKQPFGAFEPFVSGPEAAVVSFYDGVIAALQALEGVCLIREEPHHGSGYASYVSVFLFPDDGTARIEAGDHVLTTGLLLYLSRLAPLATFGASSMTRNKDDEGGSSGFIESHNAGTLPAEGWLEFLGAMEACLAHFHIELLYREPLLVPAPEGITIPTVFDPPYFVFDTLFYWED